MARVEHRVHDAEIHAWKAGPSVRLNMVHRGRRVQSAARQIVGHDTGRLAAEIEVREFPHRGSTGVRVGSDLHYASLHHEGTGVYGPTGSPIRPKRAKYLVFVPKGGTRPVFARQVRGQQGTQYLRRAMPAAKD